ncbi:MAG: FAD-dependent thymidylate synthase [Mucispirillum sp.]|nr:FAD-dependent thymidylate synthase [Mucispirillum sp.]
MQKNTELKVELLQHNAEPEMIAALAAKLCYSGAELSDLQEKVSNAEQTDFIQKLIGMGHFSVFEHVSFSFGIEGVSRALTHQLVRHRLASYSQKSQRYVKAGAEFPYIIPHTIKDNSEALEIFNNAMKEIAECYNKLSALDIPAEDARYVLPNACETKIIVTMNARELLHFFALRSCNRAQWEIRELSDKMLALCYAVAPAIFEKAGPGCVNKGCTEGKFTCGQAALVRKRIAALKKH